MKQLQLLFFLILFLTTEPYANSVISGKLDPLINSNQRFVRLLYFKDYISNEIETLDYDILNEKNEFELEINLPEIQYCFIEYDFKIFGIYIEPGTNYAIELKSSESNAVNNFEPSIDLYIHVPAEGLNQKISDFNMIFEDFMIDNMKNSYGKIDKESVVSFKDKYLSEGGNDYFTNYKRYKIASLELLSRLKSKNLLAGDLFVGNKILYNNIEYMDFFISFFSEFLFTNRSLFSQTKVVEAINQSVDYHDIDSILSRASYLQETELRELVLLLNLKEMFYIPSFNQNKIFDFIKQISTASSSVENRKIASNIIIQLTNPLVGKKVPDLSLHNLNGEEINLGSFSGKPTYLSFIRPENVKDQTELEYLKNIYEEFSDKVNFICIAINGKRKDVEVFAHSNKFPFTFLILDDNIDILEEFKIFKAPQFIILDKNLNIKSAPSLSPTEDLAGYLSNMLKD